MASRRTQEEREDGAEETPGAAPLEEERHGLPRGLPRERSPVTASSWTSGLRNSCVEPPSLWKFVTAAWRNY